MTGFRLPLRIGALAVSVLILSGCVHGERRPERRAPKRPGRCAFAACGVDRASLSKVTADAVGTTPDKVAISQTEPQFNGAVLVWRASALGRRYDCKEGRDHAEVHYVDCRPSTGKGALTAFP